MVFLFFCYNEKADFILLHLIIKCSAPLISSYVEIYNDLKTNIWWMIYMRNKQTKTKKPERTWNSKVRLGTWLKKNLPWLQPWFWLEGKGLRLTWHLQDNLVHLCSLNTYISKLCKSKETNRTKKNTQTLKVLTKQNEIKSLKIKHYTKGRLLSSFLLPL